MTKKLPCILLVDDDSDTNMVVTYYIKKDQLAEKIVVSLNGEEALAYLKNNPPPSLILLDIHMPRMNGWEFLEEYHKLYPDRKESIIIVMTSLSLNSEDQERAKQRGLGFINKPLTAELIKKTIEENCI